MSFLKKSLGSVMKAGKAIEKAGKTVAKKTMPKKVYQVSSKIAKNKVFQGVAMAAAGAVTGGAANAAAGAMKAVAKKTVGKAMVKGAVRKGIPKLLAKPVGKAAVKSAAKKVAGKGIKTAIKKAAIKGVKDQAIDQGMSAIAKKRAKAKIQKIKKGSSGLNAAGNILETVAEAAVPIMAAKYASGEPMDQVQSEWVNSPQYAQATYAATDAALRPDIMQQLQAAGVPQSQIPMAADATIAQLAQPAIEQQQMTTGAGDWTKYALIGVPILFAMMGG